MGATQNLNTSASPTVLQARQLRYEKNAAVLLDDLSFAVQACEVLAIVGPNGAGKSTLLKLLSEDLTLSAGEIQLAGLASEEWTLAERARHVAVLPQLSLLNFPYTAEQVVALGRIPHATGHRIDDAIVREAMTALDIRYLYGRSYTVLSGGEKQRCQLARVLAQIWRAEDAQTRLLLLDEPSSALDLGHQQQLMQVIRQVADQGVAVVMVVHDINLALAHADTMLALRCGRVQAQGEVNQVISAELLQALFDTPLQLIPHPNKKRWIVSP